MLPGEYNKLLPREVDPMEIIKKINAYRIKLPNHMKIVDVFYVKHLFLY